LKVIIENCPPYTGEYELDPYSLTLRERRRMKEVTGLAGIRVMEALLIEDPDVYLGLAIVAIERTNPFKINPDDLLDAPGIKLRIDFTAEEEADEGAPLGALTNNEGLLKSESPTSAPSGSDGLDESVPSTVTPPSTGGPS
jgi:hypothetical protein